MSENWQINEIGDGNMEPFPYKLVKKHQYEEDEGGGLVLTYTFETSNGTTYQIFNGMKGPKLVIAFTANKSWDVVNTGEMFKVMATIVNITKEVINEFPEIEFLKFDATKKEDGSEARKRLYIAFLKKQIPNMEITTNGDEVIGKINRDMLNENKIKGGKADKMSKKDIADKFNVTLSKIEKEIRTGVSIEKEHTGSATMAKEIAMDHLVEIPDYYTRLKKMEKEGETHWGKKMDESTSDYLKRALRENIELTVVDETAISTDYDIYHNDRKCGLVTLSSHNSTLPKGAIELVIIQVAEKYRGLKLGYEVVKEIWKQNPDINQIYLMPTSQSRGFWDKMGAKRLNDTYSVISKGHS